MPPIKYAAILLVGLVIQSVIARPEQDVGAPEDDSEGGQDTKIISSGPSEDVGPPEDGPDNEDGKSGPPEEGPDSEDGKSGPPEEGPDSKDDKRGYPEEGPDSDDGKSEHSGRPEEGSDGADDKNAPSGPPEEGPIKLYPGDPGYENPKEAVPVPLPESPFQSPYGYQEIYRGKWDAVEYLTLPDIEDALKIGKIALDGELRVLEDILKGFSGDLAYQGGKGESPKNPKNPFADITINDFKDVLRRLKRLDETFTEIVDLHSNYNLKLEEMNSIVEPFIFEPEPFYPDNEIIDVMPPGDPDEKLINHMEPHGPVPSPPPEGGDGKEGGNQKDNGDGGEGGDHQEGKDGKKGGDQHDGRDGKDGGDQHEGGDGKDGGDQHEGGDDKDGGDQHEGGDGKEGDEQKDNGDGDQQEDGDGKEGGDQQEG